MLKSHHGRWEQNQLIRQVETKVKAAFKTTFDQLSRRREAPEGPDVQIEIENVIDSSTPISNHVAPPAARQQSTYVETALTPKGQTRKRARKLCVYWPVCSAFGDDCGGLFKDKCCNIKEEDPPANFDELRKRAHNARSAEKRDLVRNVIVTHELHDESTRSITISQCYM